MDNDCFFKLEMDEEKPSRRDILVSEIGQILQGVGAEPVPPDSSGERFIPTDVLYAFVGSGAALSIANAIRDFARKRRVKVRIVRPTGETIEIDGSGADLADLSDVVGFLESAHQKSTKEERVIKVTKNVHGSSPSRKD